MSIHLGKQSGWRKSSYSGGNGACVEVASPAPRLVAVRDSKVPHGPALSFAPQAWSTFIATVVNGEAPNHG